MMWAWISLFWVLFTDKPHAPPPNKTEARTDELKASVKDQAFAAL